MFLMMPEGSRRLKKVKIVSGRFKKVLKGLRRLTKAKEGSRRTMTNKEV